MSEKTITPADTGRSLNIQLGDVLNLGFPEPLTAGYSWEPIEIAVAILRMTNAARIPGICTGRAATKIYRFEAIAAGDGRANRVSHVPVLTTRAGAPSGPRAS